MRRVVLAALVAAAGVIAFNAPAQGATPTTYQASMTGPPFQFSGGQCTQPAGGGDFCIKIGDSVTWTNHTNADHTVTGDSFGDKTHIAPSGTFHHTFDSAGTFPYHCDIHQYMTGSVNVSDVTPPSTTTTHTTPTTQAATTTSAKPTTTTTSTTVGPTSTTEDFNGVFGQEPSTEPTTTVFSTDTTRALGQGGGNGTSAGVVAALILGLGGIGTAVALVVRRMRSGAPPA